MLQAFYALRLADLNGKHALAPRTSWRRPDCLGTSIDQRRSLSATSLPSPARQPPVPFDDIT
jgi:hypothetical protein